MQTFLLSSLRPVIWENPLYVRDWVPAVLNAALSSDTQFLASQLVMDYSLLVGIDDNSNQLIVGVIGNDAGGERFPRARTMVLSYVTKPPRLRLKSQTARSNSSGRMKEYALLITATSTMSLQGKCRVMHQRTLMNLRNLSQMES